MYCGLCGKEVLDQAVVCVHCGRAIKNNNTSVKVYDESYSTKSKLVGGLLQIFLGMGIGRLYIGHKKLGITQLLATLLPLVAMVISTIILVLVVVITVMSSVSTPDMAPELIESFFLGTSISMIMYYVVAVLTALIISGVKVWTVIDGVLMLVNNEICDGQGKPLRD